MNFGRGLLNKKNYSILAAVILLALLFNTNALALVMGGVLDSSFDGDGKVTTPLGGVTGMVIQPDGKIVVAVAGDYAVLARFNSDGSLDPTFGEEGKVTTDLGDSMVILDVALQPDGKILVTGEYLGDILLARYNSDGSLDAAFGESGKVTTDFPETWGSSYDKGHSLIVLPDGKILVGGVGRTQLFALVRYHADGSLDTTFGNAGRVSTEATEFYPSYIASLALQPDGKIVAAGTGRSGLSLSGAHDDFALVRYHADGSLDTTFGKGGKVATDLGGNEYAHSLVLQPDGKLVVAGVRWTEPVPLGQGEFMETFSDFALVRYNGDGSLDTTFHGDGKVITDFGGVTDVGHAVVLQPDGKLIVAGTTYNGLNNDFLAARYTANGSLDATFNTVGSVITDFNQSNDWGEAAALQPDGKLVVAGHANGDIALARYTEADVKEGSPGVPASFTDPIFQDVLWRYWSRAWIERLFQAGITSGCGADPLSYCPEGTVTRSQMAVFLERGIHGSSYAPPAVTGSTGFGDVQPNHWAGAWIKQLAADGVTSGCGDGDYCPEAPVTRAQMAVFLLKAKYGTGYTPPGLQGSTGFSDVPADHWAGAWIRQLAVEGITGGCGNGTYCPDTAVTRAQMAVFLVKTFSLP